MPILRKFRGDTYGSDYADYLTKRTRLGGFLLFKLWIPHTVSKLRGRVLDFGCGIGDILARCPQGSVGLEINDAARELCVKRGLDVRPYDPASDRYELRAFTPGSFDTFLMSHVLEHLEEPATVLRTLMAACDRLQIPRLVFKVPGAAGFKIDKTHVTFIDRAFLAKHDLLSTPTYAVRELTYFPVNVRRIGDYFPYQETIIVYERRR